ncbi:hypothetical protein FKM82_000823 [Ascaphus truei]
MAWRDSYDGKPGRVEARGDPSGESMSVPLVRTPSSGPDYTCFVLFLILVICRRVLCLCCCRELQCAQSCMLTSLQELSNTENCECCGSKIYFTTEETEEDISHHAVKSHSGKLID